ncbi:hypothetical protein [Uliginosibacterium sediminicola]|uniref:Uncharacterized protein n=1 Tax=Uliginosibacterium sediminicola TaxID=2024550 RepID=A0ABU9YY93_9RHOO
MWKKLRITFLLFILATVALSTWRAQGHARDWHNTLQIAVFPINGDGSARTAARIASLNAESFKDIERFLAEQAAEHGVSTLMPVHVSLQPALASLPPPAPQARSGLDVVLWSLKLRGWAWHQPDGVPHADIRAFVIYWDSDLSGGRVPDSHGLAKGQLAISNVHVAQEMQRSNNVVIAHEILHTMGATDKYDFGSLQPSYPDGFADPASNPRYPQARCELMAGRIPVSESELSMPHSLRECLIGPLTAREIGMLP